MKTTIIALSALLAVQVAVAVDLNVRPSGLAGEQAKVALLGFPAGDVSRMAITNADGKTVTLAKKGSDWVLPDHKDFPADSSKIKSVLDDLAKAQEGAPVATSSGAAARFNVDDKTFERKVVFGPAKKPLATVYFGASQGTQQVDVRRADQKGVRRIDFGIYRLEANPDNWADDALLKTASDKVTGLAWGKVKLERTAAPTKAKATSGASAGADKTAGKADSKAAETWMLAGDTPHEVKLGAVSKILDKLASLSITGLADKGPAAGDPDVVDLKIMMEGGKTREFKLWAQKDSSFVLEASDVPEPVKLSKAMGSGLLAALADPAFQPAKAAVPAPAATAPSQGAAAAPDGQQSSVLPMSTPAAKAPAQQTAAAPPAVPTQASGGTNGG